jgi:hypothetical protein
MVAGVEREWCGRAGLFVLDGSRCHHALHSYRADRRGLGADLNPPVVVAIHRSMLLWKQEEMSDFGGRGRGEGSEQ